MIRLPWRYSLWLLLDMARGSLWPLGIMLLIGVLMPFSAGRGGEAVALMIFPRILQLCAFIAVLALTGSIASKDLGRGYYRVFFSRPLDPGGYYLLRWLLGALLFYLFVAALTGIAVWKTGAGLPALQYAGQLSLLYLMLGGLVFFLSAVSCPGDAAAALPLCLMSAYAYSSNAGPVWKALAWLLPPLDLANITGPLQPGEHPLHAVIYGACMVAAAVAVLQKRRFAEGGKGD